MEYSEFDAMMDYFFLKPFPEFDGSDVLESIENLHGYLRFGV